MVRQDDVVAQGTIRGILTFIAEIVVRNGLAAEPQYATTFW